MINFANILYIFSKTDIDDDLLAKGRDEQDGFQQLVCQDAQFTLLAV
jgi:hypothetical protein